VNVSGGGRQSARLERRDIERRELTSRRLLPAVERLLERETYAEISVEQIAEEAGISRSGFYNYYEDKGDLLRALTADVMGAIIDATRQWWMLPPGASREELRDAVAHMVDTYAPHAGLMRAAADFTSRDDRVRREFRIYMQRGADGIAGYIRDGQRAGAFRKGLDAERVALWLDWMAERGLSELGGGGAEDPDRAVTALTDIVWKAVH
jgi:TetR/AcrR family transcriptional regulator, ethionamide resistance regulator